MYSNKQKGFTLIELLVVISIISLLSSIVFASLNIARTRARDAKRRQDIAQLQRALELYYNDNGQYPASGGALTPNNTWSHSGDASWTTLQTALQPYIPRLSKDPRDNNVFAGFAGFSYDFYSGFYGCDRQWYMIVYRLEIASGPDYGVTTCDNQIFQYGGNGANTTIKTVAGGRANFAP